MELVKTYREMIETYYQPFSFKIGENAPKLTKQLTKAGKEFTVEEVQAFQELLSAVYNNEKEEAYSFEFSKELPDYEEQDDWAFDDSCNSQGNAGEYTSEILNTLSESRYCYVYDDMEEPTARFYYLEADGVYALADLYSEQGHGFYLAPQIILCVAFGLKLADFTQFEGDLVHWDNEQGFWSNLASSQYKHFVSGDFTPISLDFSTVESVYNKNGVYYSENIGRFIFDNDYHITYCENIGDYEEAENVYFCDGCDMYFSTNGNYEEAEDETLFCCLDCALSCGYVYTDDYTIIPEDEAFSCEDCYSVYNVEEAEEGADGCLYCCECIHEHLEEDDEE